MGSSWLQASHSRSRFIVHYQFFLGLKGAGVNSVRLPSRSPSLNAFCERFVRAIISDCLDRMIFFGERSLQFAITKYWEHYHWERNHQGLESQVILPEFEENSGTVEVRSLRIVGGILAYYHRQAV